MEALTDGLNSEQVAAVCAASNRHCLVLAGAGCGKTTVLTRRIAYLHRQGIPLSRILALTFTRKAANEMAERLAHLNGSASGSSGATVTTFHGYALSVLTSLFEGVVNFSRLGFAGSPQLLSEHDRLKLLAEVSTGDQRLRCGTDLTRLDALIERCVVFPECLNALPVEEREIIHVILSELKRRKRQHGWWDFSDLMSGVVTLFSDHHQILDHYRNRFSIILVDEFQDTNPLQIELLKLILGNDKYLFAVGDDDQAIYAFRGADIRPTIDFCTYFPGAALLKLQTNYRSVPSILNKANSIFRDKDPLYRKVLRSGKYKGNTGARPMVRFFKTQELLAGWIIEKMTLLNRDASILPASTAVLLRNNQSVEWMNSYFSKTIASPELIPQVLTVHKSKGLEFPAVFVGDMEESVFPSYRQVHQRRLRSISDVVSFVFSRRKSQDIDLSEELRLFYVAVTRAQQYLCLLHAESKLVYGRHHHFIKSRFLRYMT